MVDITKDQGFFLFSTTMPKPLQDYQVVVSCHHHKEDKSHCTSCSSGSSRQRRSHWIFFCTFTYCGTSPTTTKSSMDQIIIQPHMPIISLPIPTTPNFIKWSPLAIHNPIRRSYLDAILWSAGITCCLITSQFPRLFTLWFLPLPHSYRSSIQWRR